MLIQSLLLLATCKSAPSFLVLKASSVRRCVCNYSVQTTRCQDTAEGKSLELEKRQEQ